MEGGDGNLKKKWSLIIDVEKCEDCNNCFLACKDEFVDNDFPKYSKAQPRHGHRWINIMRKERGQFPKVDVAYLPVPCMHCDNAPCIRKASDGAIFKRDDGIVVIDPERAEGEKTIIGACPYGAIWWNDALGLPQKCNFCAHLLDKGWKEPRCVQACPTGALRVVHAEGDAIQSLVETEKLDCLYPQHKTEPRVYYKNLYRYFRCFIAGSIAYERNGIVDCAEGARVTLRKGSEILGEVATDNFGDFKFDDLEENSGRYGLDVVFQDHAKKTVEVDLAESLNVGLIVL
jgi:Fe-S-cluster-containing dehydrogenase component